MRVTDEATATYQSPPRPRRRRLRMTIILGPVRCQGCAEPVWWARSGGWGALWREKGGWEHVC